jgi:Family of unknown function (DUF6049)
MGERVAEAADFSGTGPSPGRRWPRRTGALLAGTFLLAGLLPLFTGPLASAADSADVAVSVDSLTPSAPTEGDTLTVSGTVTNKSKQAVTDAHVDLRVGQYLPTRSAIDGAPRSTYYQPAVDGPTIDDKYSQEFDRLAPGVAQPFTISVPVDKLDLGDDGVYQLGVSLSGETSAQPWDQVLGIRRTFLPWQPSAADTKTRTTYLWPLISGAHMTAETGSDDQQTPVFDNDDLAKEIARGGRLDQLVSLGSGLDVTWVIDPDLLASVDAMARGYQVRDEKGTIRTGTQQAVANEWLVNLNRAVQGKEVVALPFSDPDLAALAHNGKNVTNSLSHLKEATDVAAGTVQTTLHLTPATDFAWPVDGAVDPSVVAVATSAGADKVIARSDSLKETGALPYAPSAARPIGKGTTAVVADARLSTAFQGDMRTASSRTLAEQRFLAQSLALTQQTDKQRSVVIAPQRMPSADQAHAMADALGVLQNGNWSKSQNLAAAAGAKPDAGATTKVPGRSSYPSSLRKQELPRTAFQQIAGTGRKLDNFKVILTKEDRVVTPFGRAINREMSASWRGRAKEAVAYRSGVESYLDRLTGQVQLIDKSETKLSGHSATIPVTVQNNLVQGVNHLVLRLTSTNPTRLKIGNGAFEQKPISVSGGHSQSVKFTTTANANGPVSVTAQLYTEDGQAYGDPVAFEVRVTEVTSNVMLVIGGGVLLLVLAGFRMYTQRKRAAARATEAEAGTEDTGPEATGPEDAPEQPSDPAADTAGENTDPSATGEKVDR